MTAQHNSREQGHRGASPKTRVRITSLTWPLLTQPVSSAFKLSSYFLASVFRMTILFLKWTNSSGHNSFKKNTKNQEYNQINPEFLGVGSGYVLKSSLGASLVAQWLRIHLPMQGTQVWTVVREDPTCHGATKPMRHNYWACALEPISHNYWAHVPRVHALQQENPPQWEARARQRRVAPTYCN